MDILIQASQLLLSLSILIVLHELGHFIPAKIFKTRVEKFYLFFDPWFSLFKKKINGTEYGVGWLPLGGYVKISGMIDESMDKEQMKKSPEPWEFRSKPAWQRLIIMIGGVFVNLVLGIFIYSMTLYSYGDKYLPNKNIKDGLWCVDELANELGFKNGDKVISADGIYVERYSDVLEKIITSKEVVVERAGSFLTLEMPADLIERFLENENKLILFPRIPVVINTVLEGSNAELAGLKQNDIVVAVNGAPSIYFDQFKEQLLSYANQEVELKIKRNGEEKKLIAKVSKEATLGFSPSAPNINQLERLGVYKLASFKYGFLASFPAGYKKAIKKLNSYITQFKMILSPSTGAYKGVGGFGAIGSMFPPSWNWEVFWNLTAFLSLMLAFMNILPIPALDGGHVIFLIYEIIVGKPAPEKIMEYSQAVGMILLLSLLVFANGNDIARLF